MRPAAAETDLSSRQRVLTLAGVLLGLFLAALDQTIVATAGPAIQQALAMPAGLYAWITTAYLVASTVLVPIYGRLSDIYGRRAVLLSGVGLFLLGSFLCGISQTFQTLILARAVQGMGAAALFTSTFAVIGDLYPPSVRGRYTGLLGGVWGISSVVGPLLGGFITDHYGWHWVFFVNLPVGGVAIAFMMLWMPPLRPPENRGQRVDVLGAATLALAVVPFLLALSLGRSDAGTAAQHGAAAGEAAVLAAGGYSWTSPLILLLFLASAAGVVAFVRVERAAVHPILDFRLFRNVVFAWGNAAVFIIGASFFAGIVFIPLFMVNVVGLSATRSGLTLVPVTLGIVFGNVVAGFLVSRFGRYRPLMITSLLVLVVSFVVMGFTLTAGSTQLEVTLKMVLLGIGLGPSIPLYTVAIQNAVSAGQLGVATSTMTFLRQMGATVGLTLMGMVFANTLSVELAAIGAGAGPAFVDAARRVAFAVAIEHVYRVGIVVVLIGLAMTWKIPELPLRTTNR